MSLGKPVFDAYSAAMSRKLNSMLLARDVYQAWKRRVSGATESIRVFTPYLDHLLVRLLGNAAIGTTAVSVVTDLSPESGARDYRKQLLGVRALLEDGIEVRSLPRLHAKVLVRDGDTVTVGSQNFTSYARQSKETTAVVPESLTEPGFVETLDTWYTEAKPVPLDLVQKLIEELEEPSKAALDAQRELTNAFDEQWAAHLEHLAQQRRRAEAERRREAAARLASMASQLRKATERTARTAVWAQLKPRGRWDDYAEWNEYESLVVEGGSTLTEWRLPTPAGLPQTRLTRLNMYPVVVNPTGQIGFARVGSTRITYVRNGVSWTQPRTFHGKAYKMRVICPEKDLERSNIRISLRPTVLWPRAILELAIRFDGLEAALVDGEVKDGSNAQLDELLDTLADADALTDLMGAALTDFKYSELGIENKNADGFFPRGRVRIAPIYFAGRPVLVLSPQNE